MTSKHELKLNFRSLGSFQEKNKGSPGSLWLLKQDSFGSFFMNGKSCLCAYEIVWICHSCSAREDLDASKHP